MDFVERWFAASPDGGNGGLEAVLLATAVGFVATLIRQRLMGLLPSRRSTRFTTSPAQVKPQPGHPGQRAELPRLASGCGTDPIAQEIGSNVASSIRAERSRGHEHAEEEEVRAEIPPRYASGRIAHDGTTGSLEAGEAGREEDDLHRDRRRRSARLARSAHGIGLCSPGPFRRRRAACLGLDEKPDPTGRQEHHLAAVGRTVWRDLLQEYKRRKSQAQPQPLATAGPLAAAAAAPPPPLSARRGELAPARSKRRAKRANRWEPPGRGAGPRLAIAPGGQTLYAARRAAGCSGRTTAATTWTVTDGPVRPQPDELRERASLACGAIAIDLANPSASTWGPVRGIRTACSRALQVVNACPPIAGSARSVSDDGGDDLDPRDELAGPRRRGVLRPGRRSAGSRERGGRHLSGLYQRVAEGADFAGCVGARTVHPSVVVASDGATTRFFAAEWGQGVFHPVDGKTWKTCGHGLPRHGRGRIPSESSRTTPTWSMPSVATERAARPRRLPARFPRGGLASRVRTCRTSCPRPEVGEKPGFLRPRHRRGPGQPEPSLPGRKLCRHQPAPWCIWRCDRRQPGDRIQGDELGVDRHRHTCRRPRPGPHPGRPDRAVVRVRRRRVPQPKPGGDRRFREPEQRPGVPLLQLRRRRTRPTPTSCSPGFRTTAPPGPRAGRSGRTCNGGDGGYCVIHWDQPEPRPRLCQRQRLPLRHGGTAATSWSRQWQFDWATMTQPIVSTPFNPASPGDADWVAVGTGLVVFVSKDFAGSWPANLAFTLRRSGSVFSIAFATTDRLFVSTTIGRVFRADRQGSSWSLSRLDQAAAGPLGLTGLISEIAVDWTEARRWRRCTWPSGGWGDQRRVWHFDGTGGRRVAVRTAETACSTSSTTPWSWTGSRRPTSSRGRLRRLALVRPRDVLETDVERAAGRAGGVEPSRSTRHNGCSGPRPTGGASTRSRSPDRDRASSHPGSSVPSGRLKYQGLVASRADTSLIAPGLWDWATESTCFSTPFRTSTQG